MGEQQLLVQAMLAVRVEQPDLTGAQTKGLGTAVLVVRLFIVLVVQVAPVAVAEVVAGQPVPPGRVVEVEALKTDLAAVIRVGLVEPVTLY